MPVLPAPRDLEERALTRALELASLAAAFASPNPTVGCVLLCGLQTLGEGAHFYEKRDHAEIAALKAAAASGHGVQGATAVVTLEPCSHHGRTGPCADALANAGIARCVVATVDPNPQVRGSGLARLRARGVDVHLLDSGHPLAGKARRLNDAFAFAVQQHRPFVTLKTALSLDGKLAPPPATRSAAEPFWLTGPAARADVQQLRHRSDALLTGIGTVLADNPSLSDRTGQGRRRLLLRVVLDSQLQTPTRSHLVREAQADLLILCRPEANPERRATLEAAGAEVFALDGLGQPESLQKVLDLLETRQIRSVLAEAGSTLNGALLQEHLADKVILYYADRELGSGALPFARGQPTPYLLQQKLTSPTRQAFPHGLSEDIRLTGYLHDPWQGI